MLIPQLPGENKLSDTIVAIAVAIENGVLFLSSPKIMELEGRKLQFQIEVPLEDIGSALATAVVEEARILT